MTIDAILGFATRVQVGDRVALQIGREAGDGDTALFLDDDGRFVIADRREARMTAIGTVALHLGGAI